MKLKVRKCPGCVSVLEIYTEVTHRRVLVHVCGEVYDDNATELKTVKAYCPYCGYEGVIENVKTIADLEVKE